MAHVSPPPHPDPSSAPGPSSVPFPRGSELSLLVGGQDDFNTQVRPRLESWRRASALEVHELVYGSYHPSTSRVAINGDAVKAEQEFRERVERLYEADAVYENPLLTADGRTLITALYSLTHKLSGLGLPRLWSMIPFLSDLDRPKSFPLIRVWSEVLETCESESFDGARTAMLEQTLHFLFLPEWHTASGQPSSTDSLVPNPRDSTSTVSLMSTAAALGQATVPPPKLKLPSLWGQKGEERTLPSPMHFQLHVITRLQFNERGRIAKHRDFWDIRDLTDAVVPLSPMIGWFTRRLLAYNLLAIAWLFSLIPSLPPRAFPSLPPHPSYATLPTTGAHTRTSTWTGLGAGDSSPILRTTMPMTREQEVGLGLTFGAGPGRANIGGDGAGQAPDTDRDSMYSV
ncbi:hypothetical protein CALCODRAFT_492778 [Calocera cornea HHB12733]|uniref:SnoaL-like domain-containing protein n=1 Tax=Calocera cornea HHB12733 TaxID=1353952 RepID=A0A165I6J5_9BASI|nr:hypothetical protein CALCODRAFT_492778 [Calocera cornea HHB12733]